MFELTLSVSIKYENQIISEIPPGTALVLLVLLVGLALLLALVLLWPGEHGEKDVDHGDEDVTNELLGLVGVESVLQGAHGEGLHDVVHTEGADHPTDEPVHAGGGGLWIGLDLVAVVARAEDRIELLLGQALDGGEEGHRHKHEEEARVQAVPESRHEVDRVERLASAHVGVALEPALGALVPDTSGGLHVGGGLEADDLDILHALPPDFLAGLWVESLEAEASQDGAALCDLPGEVKLEALPEHRDQQQHEAHREGVGSNELR